MALRAIPAREKAWLHVSMLIPDFDKIEETEVEAVRLVLSGHVFDAGGADNIQGNDNGRTPGD